MNKVLAQFVAMSAVLLMLAVLQGCPKKPEVAAVPESPQQTEQAVAAEEAARAEAARKAEEARIAEAAVRKADEEKKAAEAAAETARQAEEERLARQKASEQATGLRTIHFDFDRSHIRDDAKPILQANVEFLKAHPSITVRIEGNCDERGTREYNQALGQRRAQSVKKYLADMGISARRMTLLSYGKEKPVCTENTEDCWQMNRRADFVALDH